MYQSRILQTASWMIVIALTVLALTHYKGLLQPLLVAFIIWYLLRVLRQFFMNFKWIKWRLPDWYYSILAFLVVILLLIAVSELLVANIQTINVKLPAYEARWRTIFEEKVDLSLIDQYGPQFREQLMSFDYDKIISGILSSASLLLGNIVLIIIYIAFLLIEEHIFARKMSQIYRSKEKQQAFSDALNRINQSLKHYVNLKTQISFLTGLLSYFIMLAFGLDFPFLWAFLIFMFNFIPYVGSMVATLLPTFFALVQFGSFAQMGFVFLSIEAVQVFVGSFLEPRVMGKGLNLSPLVVIISLTFWGSIWGVLGMMLSVPITSMIVIILGNFEGSKQVASFLSSDGKLIEPD